MFACILLTLFSNLYPTMTGYLIENVVGIAKTFLFCIQTSLATHFGSFNMEVQLDGKGVRKSTIGRCLVVNKIHIT